MCNGRKQPVFMFWVLDEKKLPENHTRPDHSNILNAFSYLSLDEWVSLFLSFEVFMLDQDFTSVDTVNVVWLVSLVKKACAAVHLEFHLEKIKRNHGTYFHVKVFMKHMFVEKLLSVIRQLETGFFQDSDVVFFSHDSKNAILPANHGCSAKDIFIQSFLPKHDTSGQRSHAFEQHYSVFLLVKQKIKVFTRSNRLAGSSISSYLRPLSSFSRNLLVYANEQVEVFSAGGWAESSAGVSSKVRVTSF